MPNKTTYGKKKKSILPFLAAHRVDVKSLRGSKDKTKKRASATISMTAFYGKHDSNPNDTLPPDIYDSIEEMDSMLLDDTTMNELSGEPGKRLSQLVSAKPLPQLPRQGLSNSKALPQLPQLLFNGDDAWAMMSRPVTTAAGTSNLTDFLNDEDELDSYPPPVSKQPSHARKSSAPPIPRRSSKRRCRQPQQRESIDDQIIKNENRRQDEPRKLTKIAQHDLSTPAHSIPDARKVPTPIGPLDVSQKIEAMLVASKALKPMDENLESEPLGIAKRRPPKAKKLLSKMKDAINERLHDKSIKKRRDSVKSGQLLDPNLSQLPDYEDDELSVISAMEMRINEGSNFNNPKIQSLTGHGNVRRKPIADDGKSLMGRKSLDTFSEDLRDMTGSQNATSFDNGRKSHILMDQSEESGPPRSNKSQTLKNEVLRVSRFRRAESAFDADFDAFFSSSPLAQSTPRIRLEPTFEEGGKKLKNVPTDCHSLFDPDNSTGARLPETNVCPTSLEPHKTPSRKVIVKRNNSQVKDAGLGVGSHLSKRRKKHPSPSKDELAGLEDALKLYSPRVVSFDGDIQEELTVSFGELRTGANLQSKDNNALLSEAAKRGTKGNRVGILAKSKQQASTSSLAEPPRRPALKATKLPMIPKPAAVPSMKRRTEYRTSQGSAMDTDELQWDTTAYCIGMKGR